jgi:hypothetical protein
VDWTILDLELAGADVLLLSPFTFYLGHGERYPRALVEGWANLISEPQFWLNV